MPDFEAAAAEEKAADKLGAMITRIADHGVGKSLEASPQEDAQPQAQRRMRSPAVGCVQLRAAAK